MSTTPEPFSRILIDKALEASSWNLLDPHQVRFEVHASGKRADYVLLDQIGRTLCVLEAKRADHDPFDAKEQARGYAENLKAPFIILSNGTEHWFWNYARADQRDAYRIERLPSPEDLDRLRLMNMQSPRPLLAEHVGLDYLKPFKPISRCTVIRCGRCKINRRAAGSGWRRGFRRCCIGRLRVGHDH